MSTAELSGLYPMYILRLTSFASLRTADEAAYEYPLLHEEYNRLQIILAVGHAIIRTRQSMRSDVPDGPPCRKFSNC